MAKIKVAKQAAKEAAKEEGAFQNNVWNNYQLPIADDWLARFGYLPQVKGIIYINDRDNTSQGVCYFDEIMDITSSLPVAPEVEISFSIGKLYKNNDGLTSVDVEFISNVYDPDSQEHDYFWEFGMIQQVQRLIHLTHLLLKMIMIIQFY